MESLEAKYEMEEIIFCYLKYTWESENWEDFHFDDLKKKNNEKIKDQTRWLSLLDDFKEQKRCIQDHWKDVLDMFGVKEYFSLFLKKSQVKFTEGEAKFIIETIYNYHYEPLWQNYIEKILKDKSEDTVLEKIEKIYKKELRGYRKEEKKGKEDKERKQYMEFMRELGCDFKDIGFFYTKGDFSSGEIEVIKKTDNELEKEKKYIQQMESLDKSLREKQQRTLEEELILERIELLREDEDDNIEKIPSLKERINKVLDEISYTAEELENILLARILDESERKKISESIKEAIKWCSLYLSYN